MQQNRRDLLSGLIWIALCVQAVGAQHEARSSFPTGQIELTRLVDLAAERLGLRIEYDAADLRGATVTLRIRDGISDDELWDATNRLLAARGLAAVQMPGSEILSVTKVADAQARARIEPGDHTSATAGYVSVLYELEHADAKIVTEAVRPLLSKPGGSIAPLGSTRLLVLSDYKPRIDTALDIINRLDVPARNVVFETYDVANLPAAQLMGLATSAATTWSSITGEPLGGKLIPVPDGNAVVLVAPVDEVGYWRELVERFDRRQDVVTQSYSPRYFAVTEVASLVEKIARDPSPRGSGQLWSAVTDELTGTLIVTATPSEHETVQSLINRFDAIPGAARRPVRAFPIRNRSVHELLDVLTQLLAAGALDTGELESPVTQTEGGVPRDLQRTERNVLPPGAQPLLGGQPAADNGQRTPAASGITGEVPLTLTADEGTNSLIAVGEARRLTQLEHLIRTLDVRQAQVMLEVLVISLTDAQTQDLGVERQAMGTSGSTLIALGGHPYEIVSYGADGQPGGEGENADLSSANLREGES